MNIWEEEKRIWKKGFKTVACLDEAGRGPLAGPVVTCAVICIKKGKTDSSLLDISKRIKDSKQLSSKQREYLYREIIKHPQIEWATSKVSEEVIDKINILEATKKAMKGAINNLERKLGKRKIDFLIIDGNFKIKSNLPQKSIIKADQKVFSVMAASIIAKVKRDWLMRRLHAKYPRYRFDVHKGYPTKTHRSSLKKYGPCKIHRKTFRPVKESIKSH
jgi:ribonuclease HII